MKKILLNIAIAAALMATAIAVSPITSVSLTPPSPGSPVTTLDAVPVPIFIAHPFAGNAPLTVAFTDHSVNSPTSWSWDFGDGNTSAEQNPVNLYSTPGRYTVSLTVANSAGLDTVVYTDYINVRPARAPLPTLAPTPMPTPTPTYTPTPTPNPTTVPRPTPMKPMPPMQPW